MKAEIEKYYGIVELQDNQADREYHVFDIMRIGNRLYFGTSCNSGFLKSGYRPYDEDFSDNENLQEMVEDLQCMIDGINTSGDFVNFK